MSCLVKFSGTVKEYRTLRKYNLKPCMMGEQMEWVM